jgi:hypothetical protein
LLRILDRGSIAENTAFLPTTRSQWPRTVTALLLFFAQILPQCWQEPKRQTCELGKRCRTAPDPENYPLHDKFEGQDDAPSAKPQALESSSTQDCNSS